MIKQVKSKTIQGKRIRTNNSKINEIVQLWEQVPSLELKGDTYAVYSNYESDFTGDFDLLVGTDNFGHDDTCTIAEGDYQVFKVKDTTPTSLEEMWQKIGNTWQEIWKSGMKRAYKTDFELYKEDGSIEIYISI